MPMHYPPLSDGTYRVGDHPRPLPSPVPGPDPVHGPGAPAGVAPGQQGQLPYLASQGDPGGPGSFGGWPGGAPGNGPTDGGASDGPPPETTGMWSRSRGTVAATAVVGVLALAAVAVLGVAFFGPDSDSVRGPSDPLAPYPQAGPAPGGESGRLDVSGTFTVVSSPGEPVSGTIAGCEMPISLADIREGTSISLHEADTSRVTTDQLAYDGGDLASCTFTFTFTGVTPGGSKYLIELPGRGRLDYTEDELRAGVDITLGN